MAYNLSQPLSGSAGGCPACCWRTLGCTNDTLKIYRLSDGVPVPSPFYIQVIRFSGGSGISNRTTGQCSSSSYITPYTGTPFAAGVEEGYTIDVWGALRDGVWTSSLVIEYHQEHGGAVGTETVYVRPASDATLACQQTIVAPYNFAGGGCSFTAVHVTITFFSDGTFTLA